MAKLTVLRGYSASGKSTWARTSGAVVVSRDAIRPMVTGRREKQVLDAAGEALVTKIEYDMIRTALRTGRDVVVDNTNLVAKFARAYLDIAVHEGADWEVKDFTRSESECNMDNIDRDRDEWVSAAVIESQAKRFPLGTWPVLTPSVSPSPAVQFETYVPDTSQQPAWIFDIDGTLSILADGYSPYDPEHYLRDTPNRPVAYALEALGWAGDDIILLSGREETPGTRSDTERWLSRYDISYDALFMRAQGDKRNDAVVKSELFDRFVAPYWNVRGVYDDRDRVVNMWRSRGLTCFQVAPGNF